MPNFNFPPGAGGGTPSPGSIAVNPARVIYVQPQPWDPGANPDKYVNTLAQAMTKAAALSPTPSDPVGVYVYPGTYPGAFTMVPWVVVKGIGLLSVTIPGGWTYAPTDPAAEESIEFENVRLDGIGTIDTTGKAAGQVSIVFLNCATNVLNWTGRGTGDDVLIVFDSVNFGGGTWDVLGVTMVGTGGTMGPVNIRGASTGFEDGVIHIGEYHLFDTASMSCVGCMFFGPVATEPGTSFTGPSCSYFSTLSAALGSAIDVRGSEILGGSAALIGPGTIDRSITTTTFGPTVAGANLVVFAVPYPNASYDVSVTENAGAGGGAWPSVTAKNPTDFTLNDPTGGRTFDLTIQKE